MVNAISGVLLECDPAIKEFVLYLNKKYNNGMHGFVYFTNFQYIN